MLLKYISLSIVVIIAKEYQYNEDFYTEYADYNRICDINTCPEENGFCYDKYRCICKPGYISYNIANRTAGADENNKLCTYKQTNKILVVLFELFLPTFGFFYSMNYLYGGIKLFFTVIPLILIFINLRKRDIKSKAFFFLMCTLCCGLQIWQITDFIIFLEDYATDGNGAPLGNR